MSSNKASHTPMWLVQDMVEGIERFYHRLRLCKKIRPPQTMETVDLSHQISLMVLNVQNK